VFQRFFKITNNPGKVKELNGQTKGEIFLNDNEIFLVK